MSNDDTIIISGDSTANTTIGGYGAVPDYSYNGMTGIDTITLDAGMFNTGSITSPYTYTTTNTGTSSYTLNTAPTYVNIDADGLTLKEGCDIKIGGRSLTEAIDKIEQRLAILKPNPDLESRWEQLQNLREQYVELERDLLEKEKIMKILKES
jgi:hypothetical protein